MRGASAPHAGATLDSIDSVSLLSRISARARLLPVMAAWALACPGPWAAASPQSVDPAFEAAVNAARRVTRMGPAMVPLGQQGSMGLPAGFEFIPQPQAGALLRTRAQAEPSGLLGLIQSRGRDAWLVTVRFDAVGHLAGETDLQIPDDELLARLRRKLTLAPGAEVVAWAQHPVYDPQSHRLVWSVQWQAPSDGEPKPVVNYNAALLGREGVLALHLMTGAASLAADKRQLHELLSAMEFVPGKRHADFDPSRDRRSSVTLESLVTSEAEPAAASSDIDPGLPNWLWAAWIGVLAAMALVLVRLLRKPTRASSITSAGTGPEDR